MGTILKSLVTGGAFRFLMSIPTVGHGVAYLLEDLETGLVRFERELSKYVQHEDQALTGPFDGSPEEEPTQPLTGAPAPAPAPAPSGPAPAASAPEPPPGVTGPPAVPGGPESAPAPSSDLPPLGG
jgi:hypothetical protein